MTLTRSFTQKNKNKSNNSSARLFQMQWVGPTKRPTNASSCDGMRMYYSAGHSMDPSLIPSMTSWGAIPSTVQPTDWAVPSTSFITPENSLQKEKTSVFRIHDILLWIRIRGSMSLTKGSGFWYFRHWPSRRQQKTNKKTKISAYYFSKVHLHLFSKIKVQKKPQNSRNQDFLTIFAWWYDTRRIRIHTSD